MFSFTQCTQKIIWTQNLRAQLMRSFSRSQNNQCVGKFSYYVLCCCSLADQIYFHCHYVIHKKLVINTYIETNFKFCINLPSQLFINLYALNKIKQHLLKSLLHLWKILLANAKIVKQLSQTDCWEQLRNNMKFQFICMINIVSQYLF